MKKIRVVITIVLIGLIGVAWFSQITGSFKQVAAYNNNLLVAEEYLGEGLYQKAITAYESALAIKDSETVRVRWLQTKEQAVADGILSKEAYWEALKVMCEKYSGNTWYWEALVESYLEVSSFKNAYSTYNKAVDEGITSDTLMELGKQIRYSFDTVSSLYTEVYVSPAGYAVVRNDDRWGLMTPQATWLKECEYQYISPVTNQLTALYMSTKGKRLIDVSGVVQAIVQQDFTKARAYSEEMLPLYTGTEWQYLNCSTGEITFSCLEDASCYTNGIAAVKNGKWKLINRNNETVSETQFDDVKLYGNGEYTYAGKMVASVNEEYGLYDSAGNLIANFGAKDADLYMGDYVAFQDGSGKWGYMNEKGEIVIAPQFDGAKSFSAGLAAVCSEGNWGYINKSGELVIEHQFFDAGYFTGNGVAFVSSFEDSYHAIKLKF